MKKIKYISKGEWCAKGSECKLVVDLRTEDFPEYGGIFLGPDPREGREGRMDEEMCGFSEFDTIEVDE